MLAVLLFIGATAITIILERLEVPTEWVIGVGVLAYLGAAAIAWWPRWRAAANAFRAPKIKAADHADAAEVDRRMARELYTQAEEAISIRDNKVRKADGLDGFVRAQRDYGTWYGRNRYIAEQLSDRFPDEARRFIIHGKKDLEVTLHPDPMQLQLNHLEALLAVRAEALRKLAKVLHDSAV